MDVNKYEAAERKLAEQAMVSLRRECNLEVAIEIASRRGGLQSSSGKRVLWAMLENGLLDIITLWLGACLSRKIGQGAPNPASTDSDSKVARIGQILNLLRALPVTRSHLKQSGIAKEVLKLILDDSHVKFRRAANKVHSHFMECGNFDRQRSTNRSSIGGGEAR